MQDLSQVCTALKPRGARVPAIFRCQGRKSRRREFRRNWQFTDRGELRLLSIMPG